MKATTMDLIEDKVERDFIRISLLTIVYGTSSTHGGM
jgi:hypothetical protein